MLINRNIGAFILIFPLAAFLIGVCYVPVFGMLASSIDNGSLSQRLPNTAQALGGWNGDGAPPEGAFVALGKDFARADEVGGIAALATELNFVAPGFRSLAIKTQKALKEGAPADSAAFAKVDERWQDPTYWAALKTASARYTDANLLAVLDLERSSNGSITMVPTIVASMCHISSVPFS